MLPAPPFRDLSPATQLGGQPARLVWLNDSATAPGGDGLSIDLRVHLAVWPDFRLVVRIRPRSPLFGVRFLETGYDDNLVFLRIVQFLPTHLKTANHQHALVVKRSRCFRKLLAAFFVSR